MIGNVSRAGSLQYVWYPAVLTTTGTNRRDLLDLTRFLLSTIRGNHHEAS